MTSRLLHPDDPEWPTSLDQVSPRCKRLYVRGALPSASGMAVIGTRRMTEYGRSCVDLLVPELARLKVPIVSGLALGIDGAAHEAALRSDAITVAVIGSGIDDASIYPRAHVPLAKRILEQSGAILSEYPPGAPSLPYHFPMRNRLIAALSRAVLVVEAPRDSGAMITAKLALELGREVWAVPGPITHPNSAGPHALIRDGATPITCAEDIAAALGCAPGQAALPMKTAWNHEEREIIENIARGVDTADALARELNRPVTAISILLTQLEIKGAVRNMGGGRYLLGI